MQALQFPYLLGAAGRGWLVLLLAAAPLVLLGLGTAPLALPAAVAAAAAILLLLLLLLAGRWGKDGLVALQLANQVQQVLRSWEDGCTGGWGAGDERSGWLRLPNLPVKPPVQAFPAASHPTPTCTPSQAGSPCSPAQSWAARRASPSPALSARRCTCRWQS